MATQAVHISPYHGTEGVWLVCILQLTPWNGRPQHLANPDAPVRRWAFGFGQAGHIVYLILEEQQEVHLLLVQWWG